MLRKDFPENFPLDAFNTYVQKRIMPRLHLPDSPFTLEKTALGNRNVILFLHSSRTPTKIIKGYKNKNRIKNSLLANRFLTRCSINVPQTYFYDISQKTYRAFGYYVVCEKKITGKNLAEINTGAECIPAIAEFYARLHGIRSSRWGKFISGRKYGFRRYVMEKVAKRVSRIQEPHGLFTRHSAKACLKWFAKKQSVLKAIKHFSLCHSDVNKKNIIITPAKQIFIIDNEAIKYMPFALEFYRLQFLLCEGRQEREELFKTSYFAHCPATRLAEFDQCSDFFKAYVLLEFVWYCNKKIKGAGSDECQANLYNSYYRRAASSLEKLIARE